MSAGDVNPKMKGSYAAHTAFVLNGQLVLGGSTGSAGDIAISQGPGLAPIWANISAAPISGQLLIIDGTAAAPALAFASQPSTGVYWTTNELAFAVQGTQTGYFTSSGMNIPGTLTVTGNITGGRYNSQTISSAANFTGTLAIAGAVTINNNLTLTSTSGVALSLTGVAGQHAVNINTSSGSTQVVDFAISRSGGSTANVFAEGPSIQLSDTTNNNGTTIQNSGGQTEFWQSEAGGAWTQLAYWDTSYNMHVTGTITCTSLTQTSDERLKDNIQTINNALNKVQALRGVSYIRKTSGTKEIGVIAQEVRKVVPEVVTEGEEMLSVAYGSLVGLLIEAIKELDKKVDMLLHAERISE